MDSVGIFEAKTHLSALLNRVANGETITITRHGQPAAILAPVPVVSEKRDYSAIRAAFAEIRSRVKPDPTMTIREMIEAGRRH
jgi:prevent-host-death family protein